MINFERERDVTYFQQSGDRSSKRERERVQCTFLTTLREKVALFGLLSRKKQISDSLEERRNDSDVQ